MASHTAALNKMLKGGEKAGGILHRAPTHPNPCWSVAAGSCLLQQGGQAAASISPEKQRNRCRQAKELFGLSDLRVLLVAISF